MTPQIAQGANLAFEDGLELALQLSSASDLRCALEAYEKRRIPREELACEHSAQGGPIPESFIDWIYSEVPSSPPKNYIRCESMFPIRI
ncbi:unnamed protein product [Sphagnum jensenii]|uniref:FAD-binding domain-containing protein n=1 Tax=Sphagnum jensenii TaxID=128206 RepID=A0ABP1A5N5_9BRYO